jgi:hypothetical protein
LSLPHQADENVFQRGLRGLQVLELIPRAMQVVEQAVMPVRSPWVS